MVDRKKIKIQHIVWLGKSFFIYRDTAFKMVYI
jgi:hypothetical protein